MRCMRACAIFPQLTICRQFPWGEPQSLALASAASPPGITARSVWLNSACTYCTVLFPYINYKMQELSIAVKDIRPLSKAIYLINLAHFQKCDMYGARKPLNEHANCMKAGLRVRIRLARCGAHSIKKKVELASTQTTVHFQYPKTMTTSRMIFPTS